MEDSCQQLSMDWDRHQIKGSMMAARRLALCQCPKAVFANNIELLHVADLSALPLYRKRVCQPDGSVE
jgi:hypothetical protein